MRALLVLLALTTAGCASSDTHWTKTGGTLDEFNRDSYDCAQASRQSVVRWGRAALFNPVGDSDNVNKTLYRSCLQARGYQRTSDGAWVGVRD